MTHLPKQNIHQASFDHGLLLFSQLAALQRSEREKAAAMRLRSMLFLARISNGKTLSVSDRFFRDSR